jgi:hypothetical protein
MSQPLPPLRKIAEIELCGERYDLARNGEGFKLVKAECPDAYGRPVARVVECAVFMGLEDANGCGVTRTPGLVDLVQLTYRLRTAALVDLIGELTIKLQGQKDLLTPPRNEE